MAEFEKDATETQQEEFEQLDSFGSSTVEEFSGLQERLEEGEHIRMMSSARIKKKDKAIVCLTDKRLILFNSKDSKLLGKRKRFEDIRLVDILDIEVEERKDFDTLKLRTKDKERKLMTPEGKGVEISGLIREQQERKEEDPAEQLEKIGKERERGNISEQEYQDKKDELMDRI